MLGYVVLNELFWCFELATAGCAAVMFCIGVLVELVQGTEIHGTIGANVMPR